jgi:hypothetical protein
MRELDAAHRAVDQIVDPARREAQDAELNLAEGALLSALRPLQAVDALTRGLSAFEAKGNVYRTTQVLLERGRSFSKMGLQGEAEKDWAQGSRLALEQASAMRRAGHRMSRLDAVWPIFEELIDVQSHRPLDALASAEMSRGRELKMALGNPISTVAVREIQASLPPGTVLSTFSVLEKHFLAWTITSTSFAMKDVQVTRDALESLVDETTATLQSGGLTPAAINRVFVAEDLIPPLETTRTWIVIADGLLGRFPFASLVSADGRFVRDRSVVVMAPSLGALKTLSGRRWSRDLGPTLLITVASARPSLHLPALPGAVREESDIRQLYAADTLRVIRDDEATVPAVSRALQRAGLIQFSGHALVNRSDPSQSQIILARSSDAALSASELSRIRLREGAVVFLNGCETATGRSLNGEGTLSLARSFLVGGASGVVATLWKVSDEDMATLAGLFHTFLKHLPPAQALHESQRAFAARQRSSTAWASLVYIGGV